MEIVVETLDGVRIYINERDTIVIDDTFITFDNIISWMSDRTLSLHGLKGATPIQSYGRSRSKPKLQTKLPLLAATF